MKPILLRTLIGVFAFQGILLFVALLKCQSPKMCPDLGARTEALFGVATATILSLLSKEKVMACGACQKAKARRKAALEKRRAAERQKQAERQARALAAQQAQKQTIQMQQEPVEKAG